MKIAIAALQDHVEVTGRTVRIDNVANACADCAMIGNLVLIPGRVIYVEGHHAPGCPVRHGLVRYECAVLGDAA